MIIIVESIPKKQSINDLIELGILSSVASTSFVKRFTIRPIGVDSKNLRSLLNTEKRSFSCKDFDAFINMATKHTFAINEINALE